MVLAMETRKRTDIGRVSCLIAAFYQCHPEPHTASLKFGTSKTANTPSLKNKCCGGADLKLKRGRNDPLSYLNQGVILSELGL